MPDQPTEPKKRLVKNPDTFRERALKASEAADQPDKRARLRSATSKAANPVLQPVGRGLNKVFNRQPFKFLAKILLPVYFRNSWRELRLVTWPNWRQSRQLTFAVLVFATVFGASIAVVDYGLDKVFRNILLK
jgi:preprotein translocase SecE subunit